MKTIYVVYIKSSEIELAFCFFDRKEAEKCADNWGSYAAIYQLQVKT